MRQRGFDSHWRQFNKPKFTINKFYDMLVTMLSIKGKKWVLRPRSRANEENSLKKLWPTEETLWEIHRAVEFFAKSIILSQRKVTIVGDYDVDGISSTTLLMQYFKRIGVSTVARLPNRFRDGYGLTVKMVQEFQDTHCLITVDNGTTAYEAMAEAKRRGIITIVLDHHTLQETIDVDFLLNCRKYKGLEDLCATGLVFIFIAELNKYLLKTGYLKNKVNVSPYLDLVAVATICDMVSLGNPLNRAFVYHGLEVLNSENARPALQMLRNETLVTTEKIGFVFGPHINAPGRLGREILSLNFLLEEDKNAAKKMFIEIVLLNEKRKSLEREQLSQLSVDDGGKIIIAYSATVHEGIIGILAARVKEKYNKPACVLTASNGKWKGSLRSSGDFHVGHFIAQAIQDKVVEQGGGHAAAGGITVQSLEEFMDWAHRYLEDKIIRHEEELYIDSIISLSAVDSMANKLYLLEPFGVGNPRPILLVPKITLKYIRSTDKHALFSVSNSLTRKTIWIFNIRNTEFMGLCTQKECLVNMAITLEKERYSTSIRIVDMMKMM